MICSAGADSEIHSFGSTGGGALSRTSQKKYGAWIRAGPHNQMWPEGENGAGRQKTQTISMSRAQISLGKGWSSYPTFTTLLAGDRTCARLRVEALQCIHRDDRQFLQTNGPERTGGFFFSFSLFFFFKKKPERTLASL